MHTNTHGTSQPDDAGKKFFVDIEGKDYPWQQETITAADIARLGGWDLSQGVIEIDKDNVEHPLAPDAIVQLKPGHGFAKKIRWQRGDSMFDARLDEELLLIQSRFSNASRQGNWFHLPQVHVAGSGWNRTKSEVVLRVQSGYPGTPPYGFFVPTGLRVNGALPQNYQDATAEAVPFAGAWAIFSWQAEGGEWRPGASAASGSNLLNFALSAVKRFEQGQ